MDSVNQILKYQKILLRLYSRIFEKDVDLTEDERIVYKILSKNLMKSISEIAPYVPFGKSKTTQLLKSMGQKGIITVEGRGRGTKYIIR